MEKESLDQKQVKQFREIELDARMKLTARITRDQPTSKINKVGSNGDNEDLYEYLNNQNTQDSLQYE